MQTTTVFPSVCPFCNAHLSHINLLENNATRRLIFQNARLEGGLTSVGLQCAVNPDHTFGLLNILNMVRVKYRPTKNNCYVPPTNLGFWQRAVDAVSMLTLSHVLRRFRFSSVIMDWLKKLTVDSWTIVDARHPVYDSTNRFWILGAPRDPKRSATASGHRCLDEHPN